MAQPPDRFIGIIRSLRADDLAAVEGILQFWVRDSPSGAPVSEEIAEFLARMFRSLTDKCEYRYLVALTVDDAIIGVVGMHPPTPEMRPFAATERPAEMINTYVDPRYRKGYGVGTALVRELERLAREHGYSELVVSSGPRYRHSGWGFYDKIGYQRRGMAWHLYGTGEHAPVWGKIL